MSEQLWGYAPLERFGVLLKVIISHVRHLIGWSGGPLHVS